MASSGLERFRERAGARGLTVEPREFPEGTRTADDAAAAIGCDVAQIVKSLVFFADGQPVLVLTSGANRVDEGRLAAALGASEVRMADANEVRQATGYAIGGTPPVGLDVELTVVCDRDLTEHSEVWAAAGSPRHVFPIAPEQLVEVSGAQVAELAT